MNMKGTTIRGKGMMEEANFANQKNWGKPKELTGNDPVRVTPAAFIRKFASDDMVQLDSLCLTKTVQLPF